MVTDHGWLGHAKRPILRCVREVREAFASRLRDLRTALGLTQERLASQAGLTSKYISELESAKASPSLDVLHSIVVDGLGMTLSAFFATEKSAKGAGTDLRVLQTLLKGQSSRTREQAIRIVRALVER